MHYARARAGTMPLPEVWAQPKRPRVEQARCTVEGCGTPTKYRAAGLCALHYGRKLRTGSVHLEARPPEADRFWAKVVPTGFCWEWSGSHDNNGYGLFTRAADASGRKRTERAHRYAYLALVGPIPAKYDLDHLCRNPGCCNPDHLDPVPHAVNVARGQSLGARVARRGTCDRGHSMSDAYIRPDTGTRMCRQCIKDRRARTIERK